MKKTALMGSMALVMATASSTASALSVDVTEMIFGATYIAEGTLNSDPANLGMMNSVTPFFYQPWTATGEAFFAQGTTTTWAGTTTINSVVSPFSYDIALTGTQVAWGTYFTWSVNNDIPVLVIMDCGAGNVGDTCTGVGTPMVSGPFPDQAPAFNGVVSAADTSPVPVPAAVWLFGSGLVGLAGIARRRKAA